MRPRQRIAAALAATGALCFVVLPFAGAARAALPMVSIYDARGSGSGLLVTAGLQKSVLGETPVELGGPFTYTEIGSLGDGFAGSVAAEVFPGTLAVGALGCDFRPLPGGPLPAGQFGPLAPVAEAINGAFDTAGGGVNDVISGGTHAMWVQARYPASGSCKQDAFGSLTPTDNTLLSEGLGVPTLEEASNGESKPITDRISARQGDHRASVALGRGDAEVVSQSVTLRADPADAPIAKIGQVTTKNESRWTGDGVLHTVRVTTKNVELFDGMLTIDKIVSEATTTSDGLTGVADTDFTIGKATLKAGGQEIAVTIDNEGIRTVGAQGQDVKQDQDLSHEDQLNEAFTEAGITLRVMKPTEVVNGSNAEASVGGLFLGVRAAIPNVPIPASVGPVPVASTLQQILGSLPKRCLNEFDGQLPAICVGGEETVPTTCVADIAPVPLPFCFGKGVLPGPGSGVAVSLSIGQVSSLTGGSVVPAIDGGCVGTACGGGGPTSQFFPGTPGTPGIPGIPPQSVAGGGGGGAPTGGPTGLLGLVARLPSGALAGAGAVFLVLAVGMQMRPSLRA